MREHWTSCSAGWMAPEASWGSTAAEGSPAAEGTTMSWEGQESAAIAVAAESAEIEETEEPAFEEASE
jgi:hypothetical protein